MDVTTVAAVATQMQQTQVAMEASVAMVKKGQDVQKMLGEGALHLIRSAGADAAAAAQGKGGLLNVSA